MLDVTSDLGPSVLTHLVQALKHACLLLVKDINKCVVDIQGRKLKWYSHVSRSSGLAKPILQGTVTGGRRQGRCKKRWVDSIREWTGLEFAKSQRAVENRKMEETGYEVICGVPTTIAVKG